MNRQCTPRLGVQVVMHSQLTRGIADIQTIGRFCSGNTAAPQFAGGLPLSEGCLASAAAVASAAASTSVTPPTVRMASSGRHVRSR